MSASRIVVVPRSKLWSGFRAGGVGLAVGFIVAGLAYAGQIIFLGLSPAAAHGSRPLEIAVYLMISAGLATVFGAVCVAAWSTVMRSSQAFLWGAGSSAGTLLASLIAAGLSGSPLPPPSGRRVLLAMLTIIAVLGIGGGIALAAWAAGGFLRRLRGLRVVFQDGTRCPHCGYVVTGNASMICPECGRGFTLAQLETTAEAFTQASPGTSPPTA